MTYNISAAEVLATSPSLWWVRSVDGELLQIGPDASKIAELATQEGVILPSDEPDKRYSVTFRRLGHVEVWWARQL